MNPDGFQDKTFPVKTSQSESPTISWVSLYQLFCTTPLASGIEPGMDDGLAALAAKAVR